MEKRYRGLRFIGLLLKIIGFLELIIGLVSVIGFPLVLSDSQVDLGKLGIHLAFPASGLVLGIILGLFILFCGLVCGLLTFSAGELFNVVIAIEENTRKSMITLKSQVSSEHVHLDED